MDLLHTLVLYALVFILICAVGLLVLRRRLTDREVAVGDHYAIIPQGKSLVLGGLPARDMVSIRFAEPGSAEIKTIYSKQYMDLSLDRPVATEVYGAYRISLTATNAGLRVTWTGLNVI